MSSLALYKMAANYEQAFLELADMDIPAEAIADTLESLEGELHHKMANVGAFVKNLEAEAAKIKAAEVSIANRRKSLEAKAEWMKGYLKRNMEKSGIKKVSAEDGTFAITLIAPRASLIIDDATKIPSKYISERVVEDIDNAAIKKALEAGEEIPCAHLEWKSGLKIG
jgi:hypothetical protein